MSELPTQNADGTWSALGKTFQTQRQAWRHIDLHEGDFLNRQQEVSDWIFRKIANRE